MATSEADTGLEELENHEGKGAYVSLYRTHIPRLADEGVSSHDSNTGRAALSKSADEVLPYFGDPDGTHAKDGSNRTRVCPVLTGFGQDLYVFVTFASASISPKTVGVAVLASVTFATSGHRLYVEKRISGLKKGVDTAASVSRRGARWNGVGVECGGFRVLLSATWHPYIPTG